MDKEMKDFYKRTLRQVCKCCGNVTKFDFHVPDDLWKKIVPDKYANGVLCLSCFDWFAGQSGVEYAESVDAIVFAGDIECFSLGRWPDNDETRRLRHTLLAAVRAFAKRDGVDSAMFRVGDGEISADEHYGELSDIFGSYPKLDDHVDVTDMVYLIFDTCGVAMDEEEVSRFLNCEIELARLAIKRYICESNFGGGEG